jgi:hypothetical protein
VRKFYKKKLTLLVGCSPKDYLQKKKGVQGEGIPSKETQVKNSKQQRKKTN